MSRHIRVSGRGIVIKDDKLLDRGEKMNSKKIAGEKAVDFVKDGMTIGLGTGSTVYYTILKLSECVKNGLSIKAVSTSSATTKLAGELGIPLVSLHEVDYIDLTIDGADEVDKSLNGIKGGGGALLYEKLVALWSKQVIWVVDDSKKVDTLGKFPLPLEVVPFSYRQVLSQLKALNLNPSIRCKDNNFFATDENNYIIDLHVNKIVNPKELNHKLKLMSGVVETGLFLDIADIAIVGEEDGANIIFK